MKHKSGGIGGTEFALLLDQLGIYGSHIYALYYYCCDKNIDKTIQTIRVLRSGNFDTEDIVANLSQNIPVPFESPNLKLDPSIYNAAEDKIYNFEEFKAYSQLQKKLFKKTASSFSSKDI